MLDETCLVDGNVVESVGDRIGVGTGRAKVEDERVGDWAVRSRYSSMGPTVLS